MIRLTKAECHAVFSVLSSEGLASPAVIDRKYYYLRKSQRDRLKEAYKSATEKMLNETTVLKTPQKW